MALEDYRTMEQGFNFNDFYKEMSAKTEIPLNYSGINLDRGTETAEIPTNNVMYYVSHITADGITYDGNYRLIVRVYADENKTSYTDHFARQWHSIEDIISSDAASEWEPGDSRIQSVTLDTQEDGSLTEYIIAADSNTGKTTYTSVKSVTIDLFPRYESITGLHSTVMSERFTTSSNDADPGLYMTVDQNVIGDADPEWNVRNTGSDPVTPSANLPTYMRCLYGILGLYTSSEKTKSLKWMFSSKSGMRKTGSAAVLGNTKFKKWISSLSEQCAANGIGVQADLYDNTYSREVTLEDATKEDFKINRAAAKEKRKAYLKDLLESDWTRTSLGKHASFDEAYVDGLPEFLANFGNGDNGKADLVSRISYADGQTQNAIIPSVRDVFKAWYYDASDLEESFNENIQIILEGMSNIPVGWKCAGDTLRNAISSIAGNYKSFPTTVEGVYSDDGESGTYDASDLVAIDLEYVLNQMKMRGCKDERESHFYIYPRLVQRGGYRLTDWNKIRAGGFSSAYDCVNEYTTCYFTISSGGSYTVKANPATVYVPVSSEKTRIAKTANIWKTNSSYKYSVSITNCYTSAGTRYGSNDYVSQNAPEDIFRTRAVSTFTGDEVLERLTDYYNEMLSNNDDLEDITVDTNDYQLNDTCTAIRTDDLDFTTTGTTLKRYTAIYNYRFFMFFAACLLNYVATHHHKKSEIDKLWLQFSATSLENLFINLHDNNNYAYQPKFGTIVDENGNDSSTVTYDVVQWSSASTTDKLAWNFEPMYTEEWSLPSNGSDSVAPLCDSVDIMYKAYRKMLRKLPIEISKYGKKAVETTLESLSGISDAFSELSTTVDRIRIYQIFAQESVFANMSMLGLGGLQETFSGKIPSVSTDDPFTAYSSFAPMWSMPARLMIPVRAYKKVRKKYKRFGFTRHKTVSKYIGVRWAEVKFIDTNVYNEYPQVAIPPGTDVDIGMTASVSLDGGVYTYSFQDNLPDDIVSAGTVTLYSGSEGSDSITGSFSGLSVTDKSTVSGSVGPVPGDYYFKYGRIPLPSSKQDDTKYAVTVSYKMPHLPYDSELRRKAFMDYGPLSQDRLFPITTNGDCGYGIQGEARHDGWQIFHQSSSSIADLRDGTTTYDVFNEASGSHSLKTICTGLDICKKVSILLKILQGEFGVNRVKLIETTRSMDDQAAMCSGSSESAFLSWHNYGLAAKIVIYSEDLSTPADLYGDEFKRMIPIAKAFTNACLKGKLGTPCNVVWCRRLLVGPSLFDWEFLPIGVSHKDAPLFREDTLNLKDPVAERSYIDVDTAGYVIKSTAAKVVTSEPYIKSSSKAYENATVINGNHYVSPDKIKNLTRVNDIVLYDAREYVDMISLKMNAYGTSLMTGYDMFAWRSLNPESCTQLIRYFAMTGNLSGAKALLGGDYHDTYNYITTMYYASDPVKYVMEMLGDRYGEAKVTVDNDGDSSYITLKDGLLHVKADDVYPDVPASDKDKFSGAQITPDRLIPGNWIDGKFYPLEDYPTPESVSAEPIVDGYAYVDGSLYPASGDAVTLHAIVATQIKAEYDSICKSFSDYSGQLMYDKFEESPMYEMSDMLENEFGLISAQDLMSFDDLEAAVEKQDIDNARRIAGITGSIYEKVINNAEVAGIKMASLTKEHVHINDRHTGESMETLFKKVMSSGVSANDILK